MKKLLLSALLLALYGGAFAQPAQQPLKHDGTSEQHARILAAHPEVATINAKLEEEIKQKINLLNLSKLARTTGNNDTTLYHVPVVFHVIHDGGPIVKDTDIFAGLRFINSYFLKTNADTALIVAPYNGNVPGTNIKYIAKSNIEFDLATVDPDGHPTRGITHRQSFKASNAADEAKIDMWPQDKYLNIWIVGQMGGIHAASASYTNYPADAATDPYADGIMIMMSYQTIQPLILLPAFGHMLNLINTYGNSNTPGSNNPNGCGEDFVDDTPPTKGHYPWSTAQIALDLVDTTCLYNQTNIGKPAISAIYTTAADTGTTDGIAFSSRTRVTLASVVIYPKVDTNIATFQKMPYQVVLTRNGATIATFTDTVKSRYDTAFTAKVNFQIDAGTGYKIRFSRNPGMRRDAAGGSYSHFFPGGILMTNDTTAGKYNYFYNWAVNYGYFVIDPATDVLTDYPDTTNSQNAMDFLFYGDMFTPGQAQRMRATLNSSVAGRNNLIANANLKATGVLNANGTMAQMPSLPPIADFSPASVFICQNTNAYFGDNSWNDTVITSQWAFSTPTMPGSGVGTAQSNVVRFTTPGWVDVSLTATSNAGSNTKTTPRTVYVTDSAFVASPANTSYYFQDFNNADTARWPVFNYYPTDHKWAIDHHVGYLDHSCMRYANYDARINSADSNATQSNSGNYSDFFSQAFDLSKMTDSICSLTFFTAGAYRTNNVAYMNDSLQISISTDCGRTWSWNSRKYTVVTRGQLANNGYINAPYTPLSANEWLGHILNIPANQRTSKVFFRFRFKSGSDDGLMNGLMYGTGNNFYLDRINVTSNALGINSAALAAHGMVVTPNPTAGDATIIVKGGDNSMAQIRVTDITGKLVYSQQLRLANEVNSIVIPAGNIAAKGMYLVSVTASEMRQTQKLIVY